MLWLILGVALWSAVHLTTTLARPLREKLIEGLGDGPYRGAFALVVIASVVLMVFGWRSTPESLLYHLPRWTGPVSFLLMVLAFILLGASKRDTVIKRFVRHPQLTAIVVWAVAHLISNGSARAWVLFGGLGAWALVEMPLLSARDGAYTPPESPGLKGELIGLALSGVILVVAFVLHPYFAGVPPIAR